MSFKTYKTCLGATLFAATVAAIAPLAPAFAAPDREFSIAVIPDTQNYADYEHQRSRGYPFDASGMLFDQMREVESRLVRNGGDVAFVTGLGDLWQHPNDPLDPGHVGAGLRIKLVTEREGAFDPTASIEIPTVVKAYKMLDGKTPFSVVPGNHDYDSQYVLDYPTLRVHVGGVRKFNSAFGDQTPFFKNKKWYVASFNGGASSAQIFEAGGYRFLHIGLELAPADDVLAWANRIVKGHPGMPVIVTMHDYLNTKGERKPIPELQMKNDHPGKPPQHNDAEDIWQKLISPNPDIFLVLCGHQGGDAASVDHDRAGYKVYQMLTDYQARRHQVDDVKPSIPGQGTGDGWMRFLTFDLSKPVPTLHARTYSSYYHAYSVDIPEKYASWYKAAERPDLSDKDFLALSDFQIDLDDFRTRFGNGQPPR